MNTRLPSWLHQKLAEPQVIARMTDMLANDSLHTVCQSAWCPNLGECYSRGVVTFLILGDTCTRSCTFCAVSKGSPSPVDDREAERLYQTVAALGLSYIVITSVTRDDLADGGASQFARIVQLLHIAEKPVAVEVLIPDFQGSHLSLSAVVNSCPAVLNHNLETVPRLYPQVRPGADYQRSLELLANVKKLNPRMITKSGLMVGLGETTVEVTAVMNDLRSVGCDLLTIGQYLQPSSLHHPVAAYIPPEQFTDYASIGAEMGFSGIASAPLVRSSFHAEQLYRKVLNIS